MVMVRQRLKQAQKQLEAAGVEDAAFDAAQLWQCATGTDWRLCGADFDPGQKALDRFSALLERRARHYPLQYLLGEWDFYDITLAVGPGVLIPRPDTEVVLEQALCLLKGRAKPQVADLCAGSGAIGCAIANRIKPAKVYCVEAYQEAFFWLLKNCGRYGALPVQADVFFWQDQLLDESLDLVVSNPPYVTGQEYTALQPELYFEPSTALLAGEEGLCFYRHIAKAYRQKLVKGGALCFEIGAGQAKAVCQILQENGYTDLGVRQDFGRKDRCVWGIRPIYDSVK